AMCSIMWPSTQPPVTGRRRDEDPTATGRRSRGQPRRELAPGMGPLLVPARRPDRARPDPHLLRPGRALRPLRLQLRFAGILRPGCLARPVPGEHLPPGGPVDPSVGGLGGTIRPARPAIGPRRAGADGGLHAALGRGPAPHVLARELFLVG